MFKILSKVKKIKSGIIPVPLDGHNSRPSKWSAVSCKYFNGVCNYNDLIRLIAYSAIFRTRIKLVLCYGNNSFNSVNNSLLQFNYGVMTNPLFKITGFDISNSISQWLKCISRFMPGLGQLTTWPMENRSQKIAIPSAFIKLERTIANRLF